jgi:hypothetical protein
VAELLLEFERQQRLGREAMFRADTSFAKPGIYEVLESRGVKCAIRARANENRIWIWRSHLTRRRF